MGIVFCEEPDDIELTEVWAGLNVNVIGDEEVRAVKLTTRLLIAQGEKPQIDVITRGGEEPTSHWNQSIGADQQSLVPKSFQHVAC
ncbi:MAG: hypothetical protein K2Y23_00085 [Cyanobacteria bacterium]|nr:hypothetical protein [Cyanobacteriota bacterium]